MPFDCACLRSFAFFHILLRLQSLHFFTNAIKETNNRTNHSWIIRALSCRRVQDFLQICSLFLVNENILWYLKQILAQIETVVNPIFSRSVNSIIFYCTVVSLFVTTCAKWFRHFTWKNVKQLILPGGLNRIYRKSRKKCKIHEFI